MGLNVEPADLPAVADRYAELSTRTDRLVPGVLDQVRAVQDAHRSSRPRAIDKLTDMKRSDFPAYPGWPEVRP